VLRESKFGNAKGQELEECRPVQRGMDTGSEDGQGAPRAVEPMMLMILIR
jgi:hypothetical protein